MFLKTIARKYTEISLIKRIIVGLVIGVVLALLMPAAVVDGNDILMGVSEFIALLGSLFVSALKAVAPILVFFLVISALANARAAGTMKMVIVLYIASTLIASLVAVFASFAFPIDITLVQNPSVEQSSPDGVGEVLTTLVMNIASNPVDSLVNANFIGILAWAVMLGIALRAASQNVKDVFTAVSDAVSTVVRWVINLAPFGILGLVYTSVSENGMDIFIEYGQLILVLVACMFFIALITNPLLVFAVTRKNPYPLVLRCRRTFRHHGVLHAQLCCEHPRQHGALPQTRPQQGQLLPLHPAWRDHQHGRRRRHHRGHDHGGDAHARHLG